MSRTQLDWDWFDEAARGLASRCRTAVQGGAPVEGIVALGRGGMPLATRLSHLLEAPLVGAALVSRFTLPGAQGDSSPMDGFALSQTVVRGRGRIVLADAMISGGQSLRLAREALIERGVLPERLIVAALVARAQVAEQHLVHLRVTDDDAWFEFPWERR